MPQKKYTFIDLFADFFGFHTARTFCGRNYYRQNDFPISHFFYYLCRIAVLKRAMAKTNTIYCKTF